MAAIRAALPRGTPIELWWQDEARVGQKNGITRRWAKRGTRPSAPKDQRTTSAYIYGAICPAEGKGAALVLPRCNTEGMTLDLTEITAASAPRAHAVLLLDRAGWHSRRVSSSPTISPCCRFRPNTTSSTSSRTSGNSCATTGCRTASSHLTMTSSTIAASPGTIPLVSHVAPCPSDGVNEYTDEAQ